MPIPRTELRRRTPLTAGSIQHAEKAKRASRQQSAANQKHLQGSLRLSLSRKSDALRAGILSLPKGVPKKRRSFRSVLLTPNANMNRRSAEQNE